jgi:hypothetical protein
LAGTDPAALAISPEKYLLVDLELGPSILMV